MRWLGLAQRQSKPNKAALIVAQEPTQSLGLGGVEAKLQERVSGLDTQLAEYQKRHSELESSYTKMHDATLATQKAKPTPPPSLSDWGGLAAAAAIFAASASSRRPLVAGLNAGAAALEAQRTNNQEAYATSLEGWYKSMNFALKQEELAGKTMENILRAENTTTQQQISALRALGSNENMQRRIATGDMRVIAQGLEQQQKATQKLGQLQNTMRMQGRTILDGMIKAGKISPEQYAEAYAGMEGAIGQLDLEDSTRTPFVDWYKGLLAGGAVPGAKPSVTDARAQAQNERAASANQFFNNPASKAGTAKWKDPVSGLEYSWREMRDVKDGIRGALTTKQEELSKVFTTRATPAAAAPAAAPLPRAQAESAPAGSISIPEEHRERFQEGAEVSQNGRNYRVQGGMLIPAR